MSSARYTGRRPTSKQEEAAADRLSVRYLLAPKCYQTVVVISTATPDADLRAKQWAARLKKEGKKGVEVHRWTPTVFNAAGV